MRNEVKISSVSNGINDETSFVSFILLSNGKKYVLNKRSFSMRFSSHLLKKYTERNAIFIPKVKKISLAEKVELVSPKGQDCDSPKGETNKNNNLLTETTTEITKKNIQKTKMLAVEYEQYN